MAAAWSDVVARGEAARRRGGAACGVMRHSAAWRGGAQFDSARHGLAWRAVPCRGVAWCDKRTARRTRVNGVRRW